MRTRAARLKEHGKPLQVEELELPEPGPDEVLVDMLYAGVNPVDRYAAIGRVGGDIALPRTLGVEGVGRVQGKTVLLHGYGLGGERDGLWAQSAVVPSAAVIEVPDGVSPPEAASMGVAGATAWRTVHDVARVSEEDRVLVLGASGGVGSIAVSVPHALGATVWGQTGDTTKESFLRDQGAAHVVVCDAGGLVDALQEAAPTATIDPLGGAFTGAAIEAMAPYGRLVLFGTSAAAEGTIPLQSFYRKGLTMSGYAGLRESEEETVKGIKAALAALSAHRLRVAIDSIVPLNEVNAALDRLIDRSVQGKVTLDLRGATTESR